MSILAAALLPHPPIIVPEVGQGRERDIQKTREACREVAALVYSLKPDTIFLVSPHKATYSDYFHLSPGHAAMGDLSAFDADDFVMRVEYDVDFVTALIEESAYAGIPAGTLGERSAALDHGTMVPLSFIDEVYPNYKLVRMGLSGYSYADHYRLGQCVSAVSEALGRRTVFIASGDLSHKVAPDGPYGYDEDGVHFDREIADILAEGDFLRLLSLSPDRAAAAAECGLRSLLVMSGALDRRAVNARLLSYEGTFGVGYGVATFIPVAHDETRNFRERFLEEQKCKLQARREREDDYVRLARYALEHFVKTGEALSWDETLRRTLPGELLHTKAGVFVSLKKDGTLRGCIGTIAPVTESVGEEIVRNAVCAGAEDPRFEPVQAEELDSLVYSVDVLCPPESIDDAAALDVKKYGVIVKSGFKRGLLLPNLESVHTVEEQIAIAQQKAGIRPGDFCELERFEVVRHT